MMRRGPLDRYPPMWVLRQVEGGAASGCIELHGSHPATIYVEGGRVVHAIGEVVPAGSRPEAPTHADEASARRAVVDVLAVALDQAAGWYYFDPLGHHQIAVPWRWSVDEVVALARQRAVALEAHGAWAVRPVEVVPQVGGPITLDRDEWTVIAALCTSVEAPDLAARLGWTPDQLAPVLDGLDRSGLLAGRPAPRAGSGPAGHAESAPTSRYAGARSGDRAIGDLPPNVHRPPVPADRRRALRRLITALRPT